MLHNSLHHPLLRTFVAVFAEFVNACAANLIIVPLALYSGGLTGLCQLIRTFLVWAFDLNLGNHDIAGMLYFLVNVPILIVGYRLLGRAAVAKTILCVVSYSFFTSVIPVPTQPIVDDLLTACLLGGIVSGFAGGTLLTCGASHGGLDVIGLCIARFVPNFTIGRLGQMVNIVLYSTCAIIFDLEVAIYSLICNFTALFFLDRFHQQSTSVQALIFTRRDEGVLARQIIEKMNRTVTYWDGVGAFTDEGIHVLCVCLTKFEVDELRRIIHEADSSAFFTLQEHIQVYGKFHR